MPRVRYKKPERNPAAAIRAGQSVIIKGSATIDTTALEGRGTSKVVLENYGGEWRLIHTFETGTSYGSQGGAAGTQESIAYLESLKEKIKDKREKLGELEGNLSNQIEALKNNT